jgi:hypothetical protein
MADATVTAEVHQAFDTHRYFTTQVTLDGVLANLGPQLFQYIFCQIADLLRLFDAGIRTDLLRTRATDAIDIGKPYDSVLVVWNIDSCYSSHFGSRFSAAKRAILAIKLCQINQIRISSPDAVCGADRYKLLAQHRGA